METAELLKKTLVRIFFELHYDTVFLKLNTKQIVKLDHFNWSIQLIR